jgi:hypothetical protein
MSSPTAEGPRYIRGNAISLSLVGMSSLVYAFLWFWLSRENKKREEGGVLPRHRGLGEDDLAELGDESPRFRYTI